MPTNQQQASPEQAVGDPHPDPDYWPGDATRTRTLVDFLAAEQRINPDMVSKRTGWSNQHINNILKELTLSDWAVRAHVYGHHDDQYHDVHALYEYNAEDVYSPRPVSVSLRTGGGWDLSVSDAREYISDPMSEEQLNIMRDNEFARANRSFRHQPRVPVLRALADAYREVGANPADRLTREGLTATELDEEYGVDLSPP
jgi:hypothetical protein